MNNFSGNTKDGFTDITVMNAYYEYAFDKIIIMLIKISL